MRASSSFYVRDDTFTAVLLAGTLLASQRRHNIDSPQPQSLVCRYIQTHTYIKLYIYTHIYRFSIPITLPYPHE